MASDILPWLLMDDDPRVWNSIGKVFQSFIHFFYIPNNCSFLFDSFEYFSSLFILENKLNSSDELQINLSYLIGIVTNSLIKFESIKYVITTINSLVLIAEHYSPSKFPNSWGICFNKQVCFETYMVSFFRYSELIIVHKSIHHQNV